jgi:hypothetical protein
LQNKAFAADRKKPSPLKSNVMLTSGTMKTGKKTHNATTAYTAEK